MFPQNHRRRQFGVVLDVPGAVADLIDSGPTLEVSGSAERPLPPKSVEMVVGCFPHPAEKFQQLFLCLPFCNIVGARSFSDA